MISGESPEDLHERRYRRLSEENLKRIGGAVAESVLQQAVTDSTEETQTRITDTEQKLDI